MTNHNTFYGFSKGSSITNACALTANLTGHWYGSYGTAPCPICQPEQKRTQNALTIRDGNKGLLLHCKKSNCAFADILKVTGAIRFDWRKQISAGLPKPHASLKADSLQKSHFASKVWQESQPIDGTLGALYLQTRGITYQLPECLRFHPNLRHGPSGSHYPALVACVEGTSDFGVHRTFLKHDGSNKAEITPNKMMLGSTAGGAVRLREDQGPLVVAEGIETALSLCSGLVEPSASIWAALSTSGMQTLNLPKSTGQLIVASDGDQAGRKAANELASRAYKSGWRVKLLPAPDGMDWNDYLVKTGGAS